MMAWQAQCGFFLSILCAYLGARILCREIEVPVSVVGISRHRLVVQRVFRQLQELEETLLTGIVPKAEQWEELRSFPAPWGTLAYESIRELRASGGALLPTMKRLRYLAESQDRALSEARSKSAQAMAQALSCALLVPVFGAVLYGLLPGVSDSAALWALACLISLACACIGALWLLRMVEQARWGGLAPSLRGWILASQCAGERFLALVRAGSPADIAWSRACELLESESPGLALAWGNSVWRASSDSHRSAEQRGALAQSLIQAGDSIRKSVQLSLMEGRPCLERVETVMDSLRHEVRTRIDRELTLLGTRSLKPLFICVAPALLGLLAFGIFLSWLRLGGGGY